MKRAYLIGREGDIEVPRTHKDVGMKHAILVIEEGFATIESKSSNGLYVNGFKVKKKQLNPTHTIQLGNSFQFRLNHYFKIKEAKIIAQKNGFDFIEEFEELKTIYKNLNQKEKTLERMAMLPQLGSISIMMIGGSGLISQIIPQDLITITVSPTILLIMTLLFTGIFYLGAIPYTKNKVREGKIQLKQAFKEKFQCPKCLKPLEENVKWSAWKSKGSHTCGAKW